MDKNYNVDDILLEIKSKKSRQKSAEAAVEPIPPVSDSFPVSAQSADAAPAREEWPAKAREERTAPVREEWPVQIREERTAPVREEWPAKAREEREVRLVDEHATGQFDFAPIKEEKQNPLRFDGHVRPITDRAKARQSRLGRFAQPQPPPKDDTAVIDFSAFRAGVLQAAEAGDDEPIDKTRVLPALGGKPELETQRGRRSILGVDDDDDDLIPGIEDDTADVDDYDDDYDDDGELHKPAVGFSEYNSVSDRRDVAIDIARVKLWLVIRLLVTALLAGALFYLALSAKYLSMPLPSFIVPEKAATLHNYLLSLTGLTVLTALAGSSAMGGGLISLFKMRSNSDTLAALAMLAVIGQCVFVTIRQELANPQELTLYCCVAAMSMLFNALGKMTMISRIQANFKIISSDKPKKAVVLADDEAFCRGFVKTAARRPSVAVAARTDFLTDFLALSYSDKYDVGINKVVAPICLAGAAVVGVLSYILNNGQAGLALSAFVCILCVASTFSATFIENVPLAKLTKKLAARGGMVSGNKAVEDFCDVSALVLDENDLFPDGHVRIHGINAFENGRVDEAILNVASVALASGSAMSGVFLEMVGGNKKLLKKAENITFETARGLSAWVDSRRVLVGNSKMMQSHGITLPSESFDQKYIQEGGEVFYLAVGGEACARFLVSYQIDEELAIELDRLAAQEKTLIVYTVDPNLDSGKIWSLYGYPEKLIKVIPAAMHERYKALTARKTQALAEIAFTGRAPAMVGAVLACVSARSSILAATVVQLIQIALGYGLVALVSFLGTISTITVPVLAAYQMFWFVVIWLIQKLRAA